MFILANIWPLEWPRGALPAAPTSCFMSLLGACWLLGTRSWCSLISSFPNPAQPSLLHTAHLTSAFEAGSFVLRRGSEAHGHGLCERPLLSVPSPQPGASRPGEWR